MTRYLRHILPVVLIICLLLIYPIAADSVVQVVNVDDINFTVIQTATPIIPEQDMKNISSQKS